MAKGLSGARKLSILLSLVWRNPSYGLNRILAELPEEKREKIYSRSGIQKVLNELDLKTAKKRRAWARKMATAEAVEKFALARAQKRTRTPKGIQLSPEERLEMIRLAEWEEIPVSRAAQAYGVSRKNLYKWKKRYEASIPGKGYQAVSDKKPTIKWRWNQLTDKQVERILEIVQRHPEYSTHKVAQILADVGNHGVQNVFKRLNLNTYEKRSAYAQIHPLVVTSVTRVLRGIKTFFGQIPVISAIPPPSRQKLVSLFRPFFFSFLSTIILSTAFFYWLRIVSQTPTPGAKLGLVFASVAFLIGGFFFIYSMKYYLTLAIVLSFSRQPMEEGGGYAVSLNGRINNINSKNGNGNNWLQRIFGLSNGNGNGPSTSLRMNKNGRNGLPAGGLQPSLDHIKLKRYPFISIHLPFYNETKVAKRILKACTAMDYSAKGGQAQFEVIVCDDSTDETTKIVERFAQKHNAKHPHGPKVKVIHRLTREGFKGGALKFAVEKMNPKTEFCVVFDADFVPYLDTLELFVKYFKANNNGREDFKKSNIAAVTGYQWHVLNKSENWITRGVRTEYAGSYVIERPGREIMGLLKQIHGSVYMIRADVLQKIGWGTSITEDFQLTLNLYERGYKVIYTPYVQAPAECVSTIKRLIRQRMRWAEGHSNCIKRKIWPLLSSPKLTLLEKLEVLYLAPYYLQAFFFLAGTISWLLAETVFPARLPFWTALWGWSLVLTNFFSLPLMNAVGMFLEESEEKDYLGLLSFVALSYILVPFQAYASAKGFLKKEEGPWFRTPKTGKITDIFTRGKFYRWVSGIIPGRRPVPAVATRSLGGLRKTNPYLALVTANNRFNQFSIKPRRIRWVGKIALVFLLVTSLTLYSLSSTMVKPVYASIGTGDGHDGNKTVSGADNTSFKYTNVDELSGPSRPNPDYIYVASTTDIDVDDDVLVIQITSEGAGNWETCDVEGVVGGSHVDCAANLVNDYQLTGAQVVVMPQWQNVTIQSGGSLTTSAWNGTTGGVIAFRATGTVSVQSGGEINANELGFSGGGGGETTTGGGGGAAPRGSGDSGSAGNNGSDGSGSGGGGGGVAGGGAGGGGGGGNSGGDGGGGAGGTGGGGAGGAYATANSGVAGTSGPGGAGGGGKGGDGGAGAAGSGGAAGTTHGNPNLSTMFLGSGGGGGASGASGGGGGASSVDSGVSGASGGPSGDGGAGSGIVVIYADSITVSGSVIANGGNGGGGVSPSPGSGTGTLGGGGGGASPGAGGGGGSGGSVFLRAGTLTLGTSLVTATGGTQGNKGSTGSSGGNSGIYSGGVGSAGAGGGGAAYDANGNDASGGGAGDGGAGGDGRIHIEYLNSPSGSTNPAADTVEIPEKLLLFLPLAIFLPRIVEWLRERRKKQRLAFSFVRREIGYFNLRKKESFQQRSPPD